mgnify:CR=1 FL=1
MSESKPGSYTAAFTEQLIKIGERHPEVVAITAAHLTPAWTGGYL